MQYKPVNNILEQLRSGYFLPSLSVVATRLVELASSDATSLSELISLIEKDPSLAIRLVRLANSAFLRTSDTVTSIEQAVLRIGFNRIRIMALSLSLRDTFPMGRSGPMDYERFWRTSLYKALLSKALAREKHNCNPDEAFIAGLVQEIGLLILFDLFVKGRDEAINLELYPLQSLLSSESARYGVNHREIGEAALKYWQFPENIILCQRVGQFERDREHVLPLCLNSEIARVLSSVLFQESMELNDMLSRIGTAFGLDPYIASDILKTVFNEVEEIAANFSVEINKDKDVLEIMEKANKALARFSELLSDGQCSSPHNRLPNFESINTSEDRKTVQRTLQAVAHEIRNPLTSVGGFVRKLSASLDSSTRGWQYAQIIIEETKKLEQALSRMSSGDAS